MPTGPPKLASVVSSLNPGGAEKLVVEMSLELAREFVVEVICLDEPGAWATSLRRQGVPVHILWRQPGLDLATAFRLARHLRRFNADIVHAHQCTPWFYAALSRLFYPAPRLLLEEHGRFYPERDNALRRWINRALIRRLTHRFAAVSLDVRERLERYEGLDAKEIEVVHNGTRSIAALSVETRRAMRAELGFAEDDFVIGTVGRFDPIKNLTMLVESIACVAEVAPNVRGILVGDGPERERIGALLGRMGLIEKVRLTGFRDDARSLVQCMDLFVLSSLSEGTSMALLEAMSAGVPVAVTAVGGNTEAVEPGTGWVVPSQATDRLTAAILDALRNPAKRSQYAAAAKLRYKEHFTFDEMLDRYRRIYTELLDTRAPGVERQREGV